VCFLLLAALILRFPASVSAQNHDQLDPTLEKARARVQQFFEEFGPLRYEEDISQQKIKGDSKVEYKQEIVYDSILRMRFDDGALRVDEQRLLEKKPPHVESRPLLETYGFSGLAVIFHPYYESSFTFTRLTDDTWQGAQLARYAFEQIPENPAPALYQMVATDRPMILTGIAWIEPGTGAIHRISAEVGTNITDMGLKAIRAELVYGPIPLRDEKELQWLPISATVDLETPRQHWRNVHRFTDYRKYRVDVRLVETQKP
jgi:hypothetical protein